MDAEEWRQYEWWVNSQQDPKKFKWSSPDKAGTNKASNPVAKMFEMVRQQGDKVKKGNPEEFARVTGKDLIYIDLRTRLYYKEDGTLTTYDPKKDKFGDTVVKIADDEFKRRYQIEST